MLSGLWECKIRHIFIAPDYYKMQEKPINDKAAEWVDFGVVGTANWLGLTKQEKDWAITK